MRSRKRPPTIADVARQASVSIATVSRVLNASTPVAAGTAERVQAAIDQLAFVPRAAARGLARRRTQTLGLVLPEIGREFFSPLLRGIEAEARQARYHLLIETTHPPEEARATLRGLGEHSTDGLIMFTGSMEAEELSRLYTNGFPVVLLHCTPPGGLDIPVITIENKSSAQKIVEHLIAAHDRRHIVFLQGQDGHEDSLWREKGYREALRSRGIPFDPSLVACGGFDPDQAREAIDQMLIDGLEFDAVFAGDDDAATGVLAALHHAGKRIPQDVAVAGFDDAPFSQYLTPPLTTVRAPTEEVGRTAVRQLLRLIRAETVEPLILLPTELVIRHSCGC
ncbi:MAG: LacI family DNA-binding transcriptional regulator [Bacteroidota bacterium]